MTAIVQHSAKSVEWGTPDCVLERVRKLDVLGRIGFDPFSSELFNLRVQADVFWGAGGEFLEYPQTTLVLDNPPGNAPHEESMPAKAWAHLMTQRERFEHAVWVGFTLEHLRHCQPEGLPALAHFPLCIPDERLKFVRPDGTIGKSPGHANVIAYVPGTLDKRDMFYELFESLGACR